MADVHDKATRSYNMSRIRSKDTKPEIVVRQALFANGFRFRIHDRKLMGRPDIVLKKYKTVIFVHGCFWHGHKGCKKFVVPRTRTEFWMSKISTNILNDIKNAGALEEEGWKVIAVWECELTKEETIHQLIRKIKN